jgi:hypothetical protein
VQKQSDYWQVAAILLDRHQVLQQDISSTTSQKPMQQRQEQKHWQYNQQTSELGL